MIRALLGDPGLAQAISRPEPEKVTVAQREDMDDYSTAREQLHEALSKSATALNEMMTIAWQSQHPRSYEVLNQMIKTHSEMSRELLEIAHRDLKLKKDKAAGNNQLPAPDGSAPQITNNTLIMSGADMIELVKTKLIEGK